MSACPFIGVEEASIVLGEIYRRCQVLFLVFADEMAGSPECYDLPAFSDGAAPYTRKVGKGDDVPSGAVRHSSGVSYEGS